MIKKITKISISKAGGAYAGKVTIAKSWLDKLGINPNEREIVVTLSGKKIIIQKKEENKMKLSDVMEFLKKNQIEEKEYFNEYFTLGNYRYQDSSLEQNFELDDGNVFTLVLNTHDYANISVFDKEGYQVDNFYVTYKTYKKLIDCLEKGDSK